MNQKSTIDAQAKKRVALISVSVSFVLFLIKMTAVYFTGSQAVLSDALESIVNILAGSITLYMIFIAVKPADHDHPYGHGKFELLAAAFEGAAIALAGFLIIFEGVKALIEGVQLKQLEIGLLLVGVAGAANGALGYYLKRVGSLQKSTALLASGEHILSDFWTTIGVFIGLLLVRLTGMQWLDPVAAIIVASHLVFSGSKILLRVGSELLDAKDVTVITLLAGLFEKHAFPGIITIHHTRVIRSGSFHHIDLHMVVPQFWTIGEGHDRGNVFEQAIVDDYPYEGEFNFHLDPCRQAYCQHCELPQCPLRLKPFESRMPFTVENLTSPFELGEEH